MSIDKNAGKKASEHEDEEEVIVVTMQNEDGEDEDFELIDVVEVNGSRYGVFLPFEDDEEEAKPAKPGEEDEEAEIMLLKLVKDGDAEEFETIDDDAEFDLVAAEVDRLIAAGGLE